MMSEVKHERIWLQGADTEYSWCQDKVNGDDIGYVLLETHEALEQENKDLLNACEMKQEIINANKTLAGDLVKAEQENERLKTALEYYEEALGPKEKD